MKLTSKSYVFDPRPNYPFLITLKQHYIDSPPPSHAHLNSTDPDALTLIVGHGTGFHKEQWEPALEELFDFLGENGGKGVKIRDVWVIDMPNHGESAILNEKALSWGYADYFSWEEYGRTINLVLNGLGTGVDVDFTERNLVGVGHSMGAVGIILSTTHNPAPNYLHLHLAEPMILPPTASPAMNAGLLNGALKRRDIWASRDEAWDALSSREAFKIWDPRVLRKFVDHGMRDLPSLQYPEKTSGVTLSCTKYQESSTYRDSTGRNHAYNLLRTLVKRLPVHIIYGAIDDYIPAEAKANIIGIATGGVENLASLERVQGTGHLIVQRAPRGLAEKLCLSLQHPKNAYSKGLGPMPQLSKL